MSENRVTLGSGLRIMVVDDDLLIAMDLEATLQQFGYTVVGPFARLDAALSAVSEDLDGAIVDLNLRGEDSFPLLERLAQAGVPAIVCSGYVGLAEVKARLNGTPALPKPCDPEKLGSMVMKVFGRADYAPLDADRLSQPGQAV